MKKLVFFVIGLLLPSILCAGTLTIEGSYTCQWQSSTAKVFKGVLQSKGRDYEGEVIAPWNGKDETYEGKLTNNGGNYSGSFTMLSTKRKFAFSVSLNGGSSDVFEGKSKVGVLSVKISGGGTDFKELVSNAVSKTTNIEKEKVIELFDSKGSKDDIIAVCAVFEINQGDLADLLKKKKTINTNYEFLKFLKLDKETTGKVNELVKKIKDAVEKEKKENK